MEQAAELYKNSAGNGKIGTEVINYINLQLNDFSRLGYINAEQYSSVCQSATKGLYILIYLNNYQVGERLVYKRPLFLAAWNYMMLMFTRILHGRDRGLALAEIQSKQQIVLNR